MMNIPILRKHFKRIGAHLKVETMPKLRLGWRGRIMGENPEFTIDTLEQRKKQGFILSIREDLGDQLDFRLLDVQPKLQHLLLLNKMDDKMERFLCGHDERHWFVAEVTPTSTVINAMESLKPIEVINSQLKHKVKTKNWHKRRNAGFIRQGEWFFIPRPNFVVSDPMLILKNEPLRRSFGGKPHVVSDLYREGGTTVYVSSHAPTGITEKAYRNLVLRRPSLTKLNWQIMRQNPAVFARGRVRHADHATLKLPCWHEVAINRESTLPGKRVLFLD